MKNRVGWAIGLTLGWLAVPALSRAAVALHSSPLQVDANGIVYSVNPDSDSVTALSAIVGGVQTKLWESAGGVVGDYPRTLALAGTRVFTVNQGDDTISRLNASDGTSSGTSFALDFGCAPFGIVTNPTGDRLYVSCQGRQSVVVLDTASGAVVATIALDFPQPRALVLNEAGTRLFVTHFITAEPDNDAHVSEIDTTTNQLTARRYLTIPGDRKTCETQNSGPGVFNLLNAVNLTPSGSPAAVQNQIWVGGTEQNNLTKGLFRRYSGFKGEGEIEIFDLDCPKNDDSVSCRFESFPRGDSVAAKKRNIYKSSFHDITRFAIWKLDLTTGNVVGKIDVDEANHATDLVFSADGTTAYVVDQMFHSFHLFNTQRGQDGNPATLFAPPAQFGQFGADPTQPCNADALFSVTGESPFILEPQVQVTPISGGDPVRVLSGTTTAAVNTGVDFDTRFYHQNYDQSPLPITAGGPELMRFVPDSIGTAPIGVALSPDGCLAYVNNYLSRDLVAVSAKQGDASCTAAGNVGFICSNDATRGCQSDNDCAGGSGFCNHPGGQACTMDSDCPPGGGPCVGGHDCIPLLVLDQGITRPLATTQLVSEEIPAEILDGKILFNTAARDSSVPNGLGLGKAAPLFNAVQKGCSNNGDSACTTDADCPSAVVGSCAVITLPGEVTSTAHDASYVTCTACHADYGGQDGRTWDFSQFGASLRNTMDLRGRSQAAPGTCRATLSADVTKVGSPCHFDAECGSGSAPSACGYDVNDSSKFPAYMSSSDRQRFLQPMISVHWNGDRLEVEGFEFTYRSLLGAGDCDGRENDVNGCLGALLPRSLLASTAIIPNTGVFEGDLRSTLRNIMIAEPKLAKQVNASIRLTHMADFVYSLTQFPRNPNVGVGGAALSSPALLGRRLFNDETTKCATCHNGPAGAQMFTDKAFAADAGSGNPGPVDNNPYKRSAVGTANIFDKTDPNAIAGENSSFQNSALPIPASRGNLIAYVTPPLTDVWNTAPYLHDGSAPHLLDVIRPCSTTLSNCNKKGLGRNLDDQHGVTSVLTPQQLNNLVAFEKGPHTPVSAGDSVVKAGQLVVQHATINFAKRVGRASYRIIATASAGTFAVEPLTDGFTLTLAVPDGELMALHEISAAAVNVHGNAAGTRFTFRGTDPEPVVVTIKKLRATAAYRVIVKGRRADLSALNNGALDVTVALVVGETQFARNRVLTARRNGRLLVLKNRG